MLNKIISGGKLEKKVIENIKIHLKILCSATECFKNAITTGNKESTFCVADLEREADSIRRQIISTIHEGAFLPFIRPNICRFVEMVDEAFDILEDAAFEFRYLNNEIYKLIEIECIKIAKINSEICELLSIAFDSLLTKGDLKEKNLAIRIYEKQVDDLKFDITEKLRKIDIKNFWDGKIITDFVHYLTNLSDLIEDASDYLYIIEVSLK
ncbi:TIGR00153 family protein [Thermodesulfovibrio yellowstonii]|uniref:TIGR00153 family protein n=1 Tax=Thermodesulfovibrio yellowstonii TaxID=28262 RepID=UPI0024B31FBD|nr:TIGR00153 family protein [Thermodesulfovibrio yellowstonii]MDI6866006.1 TIGR00153 family protein [Thermodesulfovibrio yellowstonii]